MSREGRMLGDIKPTDIALFLYLCGLFGHKAANGIDDIICRAVFVVFVLASLCFSIAPSIRNGSRKIIPWFSVWLLGFIAYCYFSLIWADDSQYVFYTKYINVFIQTWTVSFMVLFECDNMDDIKRVVVVVVMANLYSVFLLMVRTPMAYWGTDRLGESIGVFANELGGRYAVAAVLCLYLAKRGKRPVVWLVFAAVFVLVTAMTGSRMSLSAAVLGLLVFSSTVASGRKKVRNVLICAVAVSVVLWAVMTIPQLYSIIGYRIDAMVMYLTGLSFKEHSVEEREFFREYAIYLWSTSPIIGHGFNSFAANMAAINYPHVTYSHCNYTELLSTLGIIGFLYYFFPFAWIVRMLQRNKNIGKDFRAMVIALVCMLLLLGYAQVSMYTVTFYLYLALMIAGLRIEIATFGNKELKATRSGCHG